MLKDNLLRKITQKFNQIQNEYFFSALESLFSEFATEHAFTLLNVFILIYGHSLSLNRKKDLVVNNLIKK